MFLIQRRNFIYDIRLEMESVARLEKNVGAFLVSLGQKMLWSISDEVQLVLTLGVASERKKKMKRSGRRRSTRLAFHCSGKF